MLAPLNYLLSMSSLWLRGVDLNHRPLGYEGNFVLHGRRTQLAGSSKHKYLAELL